MGMTMTQKILAAHAGLDSVSAGQLILADIDLVLGNDVTTPVAVSEYKKLGLDKFDNVKLVEYIYDMPLRMAAADIVINRAGAMTLSELAILGKPAVLIPSPNVTDNHQYKNAHELEAANAAVLIEESGLSGDTLKNAVHSLLYGDKATELSENIRNFACPDAEKQIYDGIYRLVKKK